MRMTKVKNKGMTIPIMPSFAKNKEQSVPYEL